MAIAIFLCGAASSAADRVTPIEDEGIPQIEEGVSGGDFTLESKGGPVALGDFRGQVVALYFGYTHCPDVCPTSLSAIAQAMRGLDPGEAQRVAGIFVSVDPERDTPRSLHDYVGFFHPNMVGVTGTPAQIAEVAGLYGVKYRKQPLPGSALGYAVDHSAVIYLISADGAIHSILPDWTPSGVLLESLRYLLEEKG